MGKSERWVGSGIVVACVNLCASAHQTHTHTVTHTHTHTYTQTQTHTLTHARTHAPPLSVPRLGISVVVATYMWRQPGFRTFVVLIFATSALSFVAGAAMISNARAAALHSGGGGPGGSTGLALRDSTSGLGSPLAASGRRDLLEGGFRRDFFFFFLASSSSFGCMFGVIVVCLCGLSPLWGGQMGKADVVLTETDVAELDVSLGPGSFLGMIHTHTHTHTARTRAGVNAEDFTMKKFGSQLCQHRNFLYFAVCSFLHEFQARNLSGGLRGWWFGIMYGGCRDGRRWKGLAAACPLRVRFF